MKADISIPNPLYETSEKLAQQLGISLSDFFLSALNAYIAQYQNSGVTEQLNQVYQTEVSTIEPDILRSQLASLEQEIW